MIVGSIASTLILFLASLSVAYATSVDKTAMVPGLIFGAFFILALSRLNSIFRNENHNLLGYVRYIGLSILAFSSAILSVLASFNPFLNYISALLFYISVIYNRVFIVVRSPRLVRSWIISSLLILASLLLILMNFTPEIPAEICIMLQCAFLIVVAFFDVISYVFINLKKQILVEIIKKTYAVEILLGLFTLIISFSVILVFEEEGMLNYGDALWYCFAVVTTIGFGDFSATTVIGRILTVILGIYGIIVVALITSIIVNFYNETSKKTQATVEKIDKNVEEIKDDIKKDNPDKEVIPGDKKDEK